jgi:hypothetical protein
LAQAGRENVYVLSAADCDAETLHQRVLHLLHQHGILRGA